jgi:hypothetical protein
VTSPTWKRLAEIPPGAENKDLARTRAIARWPARTDLFARRCEVGRAEAYLITLAGTRRCLNVNPCRTNEVRRRRKIASIGRFSRGRPLCLMLQKQQNGKTGKETGKRKQEQANPQAITSGRLELLELRRKYDDAPRRQKIDKL